MASSGSRALWLLVCSLAVCQVVSLARSLAEVTPLKRVQLELGDLVELTLTFWIRTEKMSVLNVLVEVLKIAEGFGGIRQKVVEYTGNMRNAGARFSDKEALLVVDLLREFVRNQLALLAVVIEMHGLLSDFQFTEPIRVALVDLEAAMQACAYSFNDMIPTQRFAAQAEFVSLSIGYSSTIISISL